MTFTEISPTLPAFGAIASFCLTLYGFFSNRKVRAENLKLREEVALGKSDRTLGERDYKILLLESTLSQKQDKIIRQEEDLRKLREEVSGLKNKIVPTPYTFSTPLYTSSLGQIATLSDSKDEKPFGNSLYITGR